MERFYQSRAFYRTPAGFRRAIFMGNEILQSMRANQEKWATRKKRRRPRKRRAWKRKDGINANRAAAAADEENGGGGGDGELKTHRDTNRVVRPRVALHYVLVSVVPSLPWRSSVESYIRTAGVSVR